VSCLSVIDSGVSEENSMANEAQSPCLKAE
jgi:hypothetical protein